MDSVMIFSPSVYLAKVHNRDKTTIDTPPPASGKHAFVTLSDKSTTTLHLQMGLCEKTRSKIVPFLACNHYATYWHGKPTQKRREPLFPEFLCGWSTHLFIL